MSEMSQAELHLLEQISKNLSDLTSRIADMDRTQRQTLERLVRLEERSSNTAKLESRMNDLDKGFRDRLNGHSERLKELEAAQHRLEGASGVAEWAAKLWPIFAATLGAAGAYIAIIN